MKKYLLFAALAGTFTISGCSVPSMALESSFKQEAEELPIEGRKFLRPNKDFSIGSYQVTDIKRGWKRSSGFSIFVYENIASGQQYELSVEDAAGQRWNIYTAANLHEKSINFDGWEFDVAPNTEYYASYFTSPESNAWRFITADPGHYLARKDFKGELTNGSMTFVVKPVYRFQDHKMPVSDIVGYEFLLGDEAQAAVQVLNGGKVWMKPELSKDLKMVFASASASLLLYEKLKDQASSVE